jgi:hypothetical protein
MKPLDSAMRKKRGFCVFRGLRGQHDTIHENSLPQPASNWICKMGNIRSAIIIVFFLHGIFHLTGTAKTIRVPVDQPNIQSGINATNNGDTVLVLSGTYAGNINFNGKKIVVGSSFLTTGDTSKGDFQLALKSPCLGAGIDSVSIYGTRYWAPTEDIEHIARLDSIHTWPNMGAFEYKSALSLENQDWAKSISRQFVLYQNYPNPFNPSTTFSFELPSSSPVSLKIFDVLGREVVTIIATQLPAGNYSRSWNATDYPSGVYFYRLQAGAFVETKKFVLLK